MLMKDQIVRFGVKKDILLLTIITIFTFFQEWLQCANLTTIVAKVNNSYK